LRRSDPRLGCGGGEVEGRSRVRLDAASRSKGWRITFGVRGRVRDGRSTDASTRCDEEDLIARSCPFRSGSSYRSRPRQTGPHRWTVWREISRRPDDAHSLGRPLTRSGRMRDIYKNDARFTSLCQNESFLDVETLADFSHHFSARGGPGHHDESHGKIVRSDALLSRPTIMVKWTLFPSLDDRFK
jgi:hypothetical protein